MLIFMRLINIDFLISLSHLFRDFVNYFKERVVPKANRLGKWALGEVNIWSSNVFPPKKWGFLSKMGIWQVSDKHFSRPFSFLSIRSLLHPGEHL